MKRLAAYAALVLLGCAAASCGSQSCTLAGCGAALTIDFDEAIPRDYTLTVTIDGKTGTADCTAAADPDTTVDVSVALVGLDMGLKCGPSSIVFGAPVDRVSIVLAYAVGVTTTIEAEPVYDEYYPNGEDCGACSRATHEADVIAPTTA